MLPSVVFISTPFFFTAVQSSWNRICKTWTIADSTFILLINVSQTGCTIPPFVWTHTLLITIDNVLLFFFSNCLRSSMVQLDPFPYFYTAEIFHALFISSLRVTFLDSLLIFVNSKNVSNIDIRFWLGSCSNKSTLNSICSYFIQYENGILYIS